MARVLADPGLAEKMGQNAKERVRQRFLGTRHLEQYLDLVRKVDR